MTKDILTPELLRKLLAYDPDTGALTWLFRSNAAFNARWAGTPAFTASTCRGYRRGRILHNHYYAHRVIWAMTHGAWPENVIDHINGVTDDNRIANLRAVTVQENQRNISMPINNTSGHMGVYWHKSVQKWQAQINVDNKHIHLGSFADKQDAVSARKAAELEYNFHINHGRQTAS